MVSSRGEETEYKYSINGVNYITLVTFYDSGDSNNGQPLMVIDVEFKLDDNDYGVQMGLTNFGNPLDVIGHTLWCVEDHVKKQPADTYIGTITFIGKREDDGDMRRTNIYMRFVENYLKKKKMEYRSNIYKNMVSLEFKEPKQPKDFK